MTIFPTNLPLNGSADLDVESAAEVVELAFKKLGTEDLSEEIFQAIKNGLISFETGTWLLKVSAWCGVENGKRMLETLENWLLQGEDELKIRIALSSEFVLFSGHRFEETGSGIALRVAKQLRQRFPQLDTQLTLFFSRNL